MYKRFASIANSKEFGYAFDSQAWESHAPIESNFRVFHTYGDSTVQHSPCWSVTVDLLADYLFSLAAAMQSDDELARDLYYTIHRRPSDKEIAFAASVVYKKPADDKGGWNYKRIYFSPKELKISKSPSKAYDKRFFELTDTYDGSAASMFRVLTIEHEYAGGFHKYAVAEALRDWTLANDGPYVGLAAEFLGWLDGDREKARELRDGFEACRNITEAYRLRANVESSLENYRRHVTPKPAEPEPEAEVAPAPEQGVANEQASEKEQADAPSTEPAAADAKVA